MKQSAVVTERTGAARGRTLARPARVARAAAPPVRARRPSTVCSAFLAAVAAALAGLAVTAAAVLVGWGVSASGASAGTALRFAAQAFLLAHHGRLQLPLGDVSLAPMGLTLLPAWLLYRAGGSLQRSLGGYGTPGGAATNRAASGAARGAPGGRAVRGATTTRGAFPDAAGGAPGGRAVRGGAAAGRGVAGRVEQARDGRDQAAVTGPVEPATAVTAVLALAGSYAVLVVLGTGLASTDTVRVEPVSTLAGAAVLAAVAGGCGLLRGSPLTAHLSGLLPTGLRHAQRAAFVALAVLLGAGALAAAGSLLAHHERAASLSHALAPGLVGGVGLLVIGLLCVPNAAVWAAGYAVGPGFAVGTGTSVTAFGSTFGPVPAMPLLAALPGGGHPTAVGLLPLGAPLLAGALAGVLVGRRYSGSGAVAGRPTATGGSPGGAGSGLRAAASWSAVGGLQAGVMLAALAALAGGSLGSGRMSALGPSPWQVGLAAAAEIAATAAVTAAVTAAATASATARRGGAAG